jgi:hypothetical protein
MTESQRRRRPRRAVKRADDGGARLLLKSALERFDNLAHDQPCGVARLGGDDAVEREQRADEVDVRLDGLEQLGLEQETVEVEPVDRVLLHDAHDRGREVLADVAEPAGDARGRRVEPCAARATALLAVDRVQGLVNLRLAPAE